MFNIIVLKFKEYSWLISWFILTENLAATLCEFSRILREKSDLKENFYENSYGNIQML